VKVRVGGEPGVLAVRPIHAQAVQTWSNQRPLDRRRHSRTRGGVGFVWIRQLDGAAHGAGMPTAQICRHGAARFMPG
jgi:hypothetical protein